MSDPSSNITMYESESELRRGPWTLEEDNLLIQYISCHGEGRWNSLAKFAGLKRTGKSCRLRWLNYLKPDIKRGNLTPHEQLLILELHCKWGNRWSKIAQHLPGRTDNEIKNYWRTRVQKQARQLKVDSNSKNFLEAIRTFWIPRLVEQMEQNSTPSSSSTPDFQKASSNQQVNNNNNSVDSDPQVNNSGSHFPSQSLTAGKIPSSSEISIEDSRNYNVGFSFPSCYDDMQDAGVSQCHVAGMDWFGEELGGTFWNSDELWQFRKWEDVDDML